MTSLTVLPGEGLDAPAIDGLYRAHARSLRVIVRNDVSHVHEAVVEDACQFAWMRLIVHASRIRGDTALNWLARTAINEAFKLLARQARDVSLEETEDREAPVIPEPGPGPDELALAQARLAITGDLSRRQQQFVWMHAAGLTYVEIAARTGATVRTVERQLLRAKRRLRASAA